MMKLVFLGTSGSTPTKDKGLPAVAIEKEGEVFLFDCGEGTQRQAMAFGINISKIKAIFLTHAHGDHILGIAGLVRTLALNKRALPLLIFVPKGEEKYVDTLVRFDRALIGYQIIIKGIGAGEVYKGNDFTVSSFKVKHNIPAVGFVFRVHEKAKFIKDKAQKLGLKGMMFKELMKKGYIDVKGKRVKLKDVTFKVPGKTIVYATDTRPVQNTVTAAKNADILIHETSYSNENADLAKERFHCTSAEAANIAKASRCKKLILFHISARYKDPAKLLKEARQIFKNTEIAKDGMKIQL